MPIRVTTEDKRIIQNLVEKYGVDLVVAIARGQPKKRGPRSKAGDDLLIAYILNYVAAMYDAYGYRNAMHLARSSVFQIRPNPSKKDDEARFIETLRKRVRRGKAVWLKEFGSPMPKYHFAEKPSREQIEGLISKLFDPLIGSLS